MRIVSLSIMSVMFWTGVAVAQTPDQTPDPRHSTPVVAQGVVVEAREQAVTRQLNADVYARDRAIEASNARLAAEHAGRIRATDEANAASAAAGRAAMTAWSARRAEDAARDQRKAETYDRAMSQWRAAVAACEAGDLSRCAPRPN